MRQEVNEEMHIEEEWFADARKQTTGTLHDFINHVMNDYRHDYGTACHAIAACAIAAAWAASAGVGITGFQAGFVMWDFIRQWEFSSNKCGLRIIDYDNMLYPQYEEKFAKTISNDTWEMLQKQAAEKLKDCEHCHPNVIKHWKSIVDGNVPFGYTVVDRR